MNSGAAALTSIGKLLIAVGLVFALIGLAVYTMGRYGAGTHAIGAGERGVPGDLVLRVGGVTIYLPLATCILLSVLLSVLLTVGWYIAGALRR